MPRPCFAVSVLWLTFALSSARAGDLNMEELQKLLPANGPQTIEALIPNLPEDYLRYFTAVYGQESSQPGSFEAPRIISFGSKANFILAFNGHNGAEGGNRIETIRVNPDTGNFDFQELIFDPEGKKPPKTSSINPDRCKECHGRPPLPRWANYRYWPGVYGSMDSRVPVSQADRDAVWNMNGLDGRRSIHGMVDDKGLSDEEKAPFLATMREPEKYKTFLENRSKHPRYQHLILPKAAAGGNGSYLTGFKDLLEFDREPNAMLGFFLHRYLARNLAARAGRSAFAAKYATIFVASLLGCDVVPVTIDEYGRTTPKEPEKQTALIEQLNAEMTRDLIQIGAKERERLLGANDLMQHRAPLSLLLGIPINRGAWNIGGSSRTTSSDDGSGFPIESLIANELLKKIVTDNKLDPKLHSQGSLATVYPEDSKQYRDGYGAYIKDRRLIASLDAIATGVVNERVGLADMRKAKAKVCEAIRPQIVAAIEGLKNVKVDYDTARTESAGH